MLDKFQSIDVMTQQISEGYLYYLLRGNSQLGYLCIKEEEEQSLFISKIYLKANQRGNGYGKQMMEFAMKKALELNLSQLRLTVNKYNSKTIAAYERMGFIKKREVVFDIGNGYVMDDYEMVLKL
ncbi:MAG: GNAT family N-acetyltransferase [Bacteroidetes bacterium]|nr:MAG: GNAT family N-acetyltransferase [Bacteroidota bacterium]